MKIKVGQKVLVQRSNGRISTGIVDKVWRGGRVLLVEIGKGSGLRWLNYSWRKSTGRYVRQYFLAYERDYIIRSM